MAFLVEHGTAVWAAAVAIGALAWGPGVRRRRERRERRATEAELASRLPKVGQLDAGIVTVRGVLRGGRARSSATTIAGMRLASPVRERSAALWLDCEGTQVELDGRIEVVRGTESTLVGKQRISTVRDGDEVIACARMAHVATGDVAGYREAAGAWRMTEAGEPIEVIAVRPAPAIRPLDVTSSLGHLVLGALVVMATLSAVGFTVFEVATRAPRQPHLFSWGPEQRGELDALAIAAATPLAHKQATHAFAEIALGAMYVDNDHRERVRARRNGCGELVRVLDAQDRNDELLAAARHCGDQDAAKTALVRLGRYREAVATQSEVRDADRDVVAAIGAGDWAAAAESLSVTGRDDSRECLLGLVQRWSGQDPLGELPGDDECAAHESDVVLELALAANPPVPDGADVAADTVAASGAVAFVPAASPTLVDAALTAAGGGDGSRLAELLVDHRLVVIGDGGPLVAVLRKVRNDQNLLAARMRTAMTSQAEHFDVVHQLQVLRTQRDVAAALGDHAEQARAQDLIDRIRAAFAGRRAFVALALWRAPPSWRHL